MKARWTGGAYHALSRLFDCSDRRIGSVVRHFETLGYPSLLSAPLTLPTAGHQGAQNKKYDQILNLTQIIAGCFSLFVLKK